MRPQLRSKLVRLAIAGVLATGFSSAKNALAANHQQQVNVPINHTIGPVTEQIMRRSAARVLHYIADARSAIIIRDVVRAGFDLQQARILINIIKSQEPAAKVHDHIGVARQHLNYESTEAVTADIIPIEADLTEIKGFVPVKQARKHIQLVREHLKKGDKAGAKKELEAADATLIFTEVDLPLLSTEKKVIAAQNALNNNQLVLAEKMLKQAENGVQFLSATVSAPITRARQSLWQATRNYAARNTTAAKADIASAVGWLGSATKSTDKNTRIEAVRLRHRLENLKGKMGQAGEVSGSTLLNLWQHSKALAEYEAERFSTGLGKLHGASVIKADLISARLHLAFAESDHFVRGRTAEVSNQLSQAKDYLNKAAKASNKVLVVKIDEMRVGLKDIRRNMDDRGAKAHARYEKLMAAMNLLIHNL